MATSSPYSSNDYGVFNYRPYSLPIQSIANAFVAKNNSWELGAQRVKSRYDSMLDLDLSKEENRKIRDEFMQKAQTDLQKLSTKDLSDPNIQRQGLTLFQPLLQDKGILYDDQATKHYKKILSDAEQLRKKDNGKYYNEANVQYALDGWDDFLKNPDRNSGEQYLQKAKTLTPYYDYTTEANTALKNCKPDEAGGDQIVGMYIKHVSSSALSAQKISGCLEAGLSHKALKQMSINGYTTYKNNPQALRDQYMPLISGERENISAQNASISALLTNKDKLSKLKPEELKKMGIQDLSQVTPEYFAHLEESKKNNDMRLDNLNKTIGQLSSGDLSPITGNNLEPIAGRIYAKGYMENFGRGFANSNTQETTKADPVQLMVYGQDRQDNRQEDSQNFQVGMENKKQMFDLRLQERRETFDLAKEQLKAETDLAKTQLKNGNLSVLKSSDLADAAHFNPAFEGDVVEANGYNNLVKKKEDILADKNSTNQVLLAQMKTLGMPKEITMMNSPEAKSWYDTFTKSLLKDDPAWKIIKPYEEKMAQLSMDQDMVNNTLSEVDKGLANIKNPNEPLYNAIVADKTPVYGQTTKADMLHDIQTGKAKLSIDKAPLGRISYEYTGTDGKPKVFDMPKIDMDSNLKKQFEQLADYLDKSKDYHNTILQTRDKIAAEKTIVQTQGFGFAELNDKDSPFKQRVAQRLGVSAKDIDNITIGDTDLKGNFIITINPDSKDEKFQENAIQKLKQTYGVSSIKEVPGQPGSFVVPGFEKFNIIDGSKTSARFEPFIRNLETKVTNGNPQNTKLIRSSDPHRQYGMEISPSINPGQYTYRIYDQNNQTADIFMDRKTALNKFDILLGTNAR